MALSYWQVNAARFLLQQGADLEASSLDNMYFTESPYLRRGLTKQQVLHWRKLDVLQDLLAHNYHG